MRPLGTVLAMTLALSMLVAGCGLLETNDDEMETLRAELIQMGCPSKYEPAEA